MKLFTCRHSAMRGGGEKEQWGEEEKRSNEGRRRKGSFNVFLISWIPWKLCFLRPTHLIIPPAAACFFSVWPGTAVISAASSLQSVQGHTGVRLDVDSEWTSWEGVLGLLIVSLGDGGTVCYRVTMLESNNVTEWLCYRVTVLPSDSVTEWPCYSETVWQSERGTVWHSDCVTLTILKSDSIAQWLCYRVTVLLSDCVTECHCYRVTVLQWDSLTEWGNFLLVDLLREAIP